MNEAQPRFSECMCMWTLSYNNPIITKKPRSINKAGSISDEN